MVCLAAQGQAILGLAAQARAIQPLGTVAMARTAQALMVQEHRQTQAILAAAEVAATARRRSQQRSSLHWSWAAAVAAVHQQSQQQSCQLRLLEAAPALVALRLNHLEHDISDRQWSELTKLAAKYSWCRVKCYSWTQPTGHHHCHSNSRLSNHYSRRWWTSFFTNSAACCTSSCCYTCHEDHTIIVCR